MSNIELGFKDALHRMAAYQYLAPLVAGRAVLEVGCGAGDGLRQLWALGARRVVGLDRSIRRAQRRVTGLEDRVTLRAARPPRLGLGQERFDLVILSDATWLQQHPRLLDELEAARAEGGWILLRAESGDHPAATGGVEYGELLDLVEERFGVVRVLGQSPFVGYSVVELSDTGAPELDLTLDGALMGGDVEEVSTYLVLCGGPASAPVEAPYGIVQVPSVGDKALEQWWDSLGDVEPPTPEPVTASPEPVTASPEPEPEREPETRAPEPETRASEPETRAPEPLAPEREPETREPEARAPEPEARASEPEAPRPEAPKPPAPPFDLASYLDQSGGRISRWRWR